MLLPIAFGSPPNVPRHKLSLRTRLTLRRPSSAKRSRSSSLWAHFAPKQPEVSQAVSSHARSAEGRRKRHEHRGDVPTVKLLEDLSKTKARGTDRTQPQLSRRTFAGSIRDARHAGNQPASAPTDASTTPASTSVIGSRGSRP